MRPDRLRPIADRFNLDKEAVLDNVLDSRAYTSEQQRDLLDFQAASETNETKVAGKSCGNCVNCVNCVIVPEGVRRVQDREDTAVPHAVCDHPDAGGERILWRDFIYLGRRNCSAKLLSSSQ